MKKSTTWEAVFYSTEADRCPVLEELRKLPKEDRVEIGHTLRLVQEEGPEIGIPFAEPIRGEISAIRVRVGRTRWRLLFFTRI